MKTLDLFAGMGGIALAFENAGYETVYANDFNKHVKPVYDANHSTALSLGDIQAINPLDLPEYDVLLGGFPCQPFSVAGYRQGFQDEKGRGNLFFSIANIIEQTRPRAFMLENVKGLLSHDKGRTLQIILKTLEDELGYMTKVRVLNTKTHGNLPQNRERVFIVGFADPVLTWRFNFPCPIPLTVKIADLLDETSDPKYWLDHKPSPDEKTFGKIFQVHTVRGAVEVGGGDVCNALTASMSKNNDTTPLTYDGSHIRKLSPRECARFQGFPDSYIFPPAVSDTQLYKMIGNSVSVPVVQRIAENIINLL